MKSSFQKTKFKFPTRTIGKLITWSSIIQIIKYFNKLQKSIMYSNFFQLEFKSHYIKSNLGLFTKRHQLWPATATIYILTRGLALIKIKIQIWKLTFFYFGKKVVKSPMCSIFICDQKWVVFISCVIIDDSLFLKEIFEIFSSVWYQIL